MYWSKMNLAWRTIPEEVGTAWNLDTDRLNSWMTSLLSQLEHLDGLLL